MPGNFKVCVCGGAGGIGQPLCMLMALNEHVSELSIMDLNISMVPAAGVAADLGHIEKRVKVKSYSLDKDDKPVDKLEECLTGCHLVLVPAGVPRKPGQDRADLLNINAGIAKNIVEACGKFCPEAILGLIVNPVNSVVPAMAELYKKKGLDPMKVIGVTSLDVVRANKFVHEITGQPLHEINVPVIGGHAGKTILPVFKQDATAAKYLKDEAGEKGEDGKLKEGQVMGIPDLDVRVQDAGTEVVAAKNGKGSATLSMAYAGARFAGAVLAGLAGDERQECCYCMSKSQEGLDYFSQKCTFGATGITSVHDLPSLSEYETKRLAEVVEQLKGEIQAGLDYAAANELSF
jgi:malate dehydrogenase